MRSLIHVSRPGTRIPDHPDQIHGRERILMNDQISTGLDFTNIEDMDNFTLKRKGKLKEFWRRLRKNRAAMVGLILMMFILFCALFANVIADKELVTKQDVSIRYVSPCREHLFGTDEFGRDIFTRVIFGSRISVVIGVTAASTALLLGGFFGSLASFYGKWVDDLIMRLMDMLMAIPATLMALTIVAALGGSTVNLIIALGLSYMPSFARIVRSSMMSVSGMEYVDAARAYGSPNPRIIFKEIIPNAASPIIVQTTQSIAGMILTAASLSFIGMGVQAPNPEWGAMLSAAREYMRQYPYMIIWPGVFIIITALSFNLVGDGLRDALDPKLKK